MLTESEVIDAVCKHLQNDGWKILSTCEETERGDDIVAYHPRRNVNLVVEAKGETSSKEHTARFGKSFSGAQVTNYVSRAFFRAASQVGSSCQSAIALPETPLHIERIQRIKNALKKLDLEVFWVAPGGSVRVEGIQYES